MSKNLETIELPIEAFVLLIQHVAQAVVNHTNLPARKVQPGWLHSQVGMLDELVGKFENLHKKEQEES